jgi:hypothetical protein
MRFWPRSHGIALALAVVACAKDDSGDDSATATTQSNTTAESSTAASTGATSSAETGTSSSTSGTSTDSGGGDSGELPPCANASDQQMCEATFGCQWDHTPGKCVWTCDQLHTENLCTMEMEFCTWDGSTCSPK